MLSKGGPVHSIEPQICQGAKQAKDDAIDLMIIGDASDYIYLAEWISSYQKTGLLMLL